MVPCRARRVGSLFTLLALTVLLAWDAGTGGLPRLAVAQSGKREVASAGDAAKGLALYKQGKLDEACRMFLKVANAQPESGSAWADVGLCELKRNNLAASIHASLLAVRYGDQRIRKNAYFNLDMAEFRLPLPEDRDCAPMACRKEFACGKELSLCTSGMKLEGGAFSSAFKEVLVVDSEEVDRAKDYLLSRDPPLTWRVLQKSAPGGLAVVFIGPIVHAHLVVLKREQQIESMCHTQECADEEEVEKPTHHECVILAIDPGGKRMGYKCQDFDEDDKPTRTEFNEVAFDINLAN